MKKFLQTVTSFLVMFTMIAAPVADAQTRGRQTNGNAHNSTSTQENKHKPASRPSGNGNTRPANGGGSHTAPRPGHATAPSGGTNHKPGNNHKPDNNHNGVVNRPSGGSHNSCPGNLRPGNNHPGNNRPGNGGYRPGVGPVRPGASHAPAPTVRPGAAHHRPVAPVHHRPARPPMHPADFRHPVPFFGHFNRPVPPPRWHYRGGGPSFGTILGVALGTALGVSINSLVNSGYNVSSYGSNVVYLNNVAQMNYTWPDAALYYTNGILTGSQFTYPSAYYDMSRYNSLYNTFVSQYGMPVQTSNQGGLMSATWYGAGNRYVTLSFSSQYNGSYYTTLSFGN